METISKQLHHKKESRVTLYKVNMLIHKLDRALAERMVARKSYTLLLDIRDRKDK